MVDGVDEGEANLTQFKGKELNDGPAARLEPCWVGSLTSSRERTLLEVESLNLRMVLLGYAVCKLAWNRVGPNEKNHGTGSRRQWVRQLHSGTPPPN